MAAQSCLRVAERPMVSREWMLAAEGYTNLSLSGMLTQIDTNGAPNTTKRHSDFASHQGGGIWDAILPLHQCIYESSSTLQWLRGGACEQTPYGCRSRYYVDRRIGDDILNCGRCCAIATRTCKRMFGERSAPRWHGARKEEAAMPILRPPVCVTSGASCI